MIYYRIKNLFWYYLFLLGTQLGDETYYSIFFCFWFWNIDGAVGRRLMLVWNLVMYIGQGNTKSSHLTPQNIYRTTSFRALSSISTSF